jgi:predicted aconitase with swiveling domain
MSGPISFPGEVLAPGEAAGTALVLEEPLSLWGGMDPGSGRLIDAHHPQHDALITGRVLVMASARGSSSSSSVLAEAVRARTAPAAILLGEAELILTVGAAVAEELYGRRVPIVVLKPEDLTKIPDDAAVTIGKGGGLVTVDRANLDPAHAR